MTYTEDDEEIHILFRLVRFADRNRSLDRDYIDDVHEFYLDKDYITGEQMENLRNIYEENNIGDLYENNY